MDKMMSREFFECLCYNQKVKIINKYCDETWKGIAKNLPESLKREEIKIVITTSDYLLIQTK